MEDDEPSLREEHRNDRRADKAEAAGLREDDLKTHADNRGIDRDEWRGHLHSARRRNIAQLVVYILFAALVIFIYNSQETDNKQRCISGASSRQAQRDTINAIADLAQATTNPVPGVKPMPRTPEEQMRIDAFMAQIAVFRHDTLAKVKGNSACAKYGLDK